MKNKYILDTMALILKLEKRQLSTEVKAIFNSAEIEETELIIPAMVLAEIAYLSEKKRIKTNPEETKKYFQSNNTINVEAMTERIIEKSFEINDIPELHDRIIAGTAFFYESQLITNDPIIMKSKFIETVW
jgi:predicted nucleic acid-binding protein